MNLLEAIDDPRLFAQWFRTPETWTAWRAFIATLFAHRMSDEELAIFRECTGRDAPPTEAFAEAWLICGRRAGKSFVLALIATYLALFRDYRVHLAPGERATVMVIATDRRQARTIMRYIRALILEVPALAVYVERDTSDAFDLTKRVSIEVLTASFRSVRGYTVCAALCDELAFWPSEDASEPDYAILDALRPAMATIPSAMLLCASSPYARRGSLWDAHRSFYGREDALVLVWQAPTRRMNPSVPQSVVDRAVERDPASAAAEFGAQFRSDIEAFLSREAVEACVSTGIRERAPAEGTTYRAFVDPSGGSADAMTLAIGHRDGDRVVVDALRRRAPPFSPEDVVTEFAATLKRYGVSSVTGDRYGGEWPREAFRRQGVSYDLADKTRSELYQTLLPLVMSRTIDLVDDDRLVNELVTLERRTSRGGRDSIDHAPGAHDDVANAVAGVAALAASRPAEIEPFRWYVGD